MHGVPALAPACARCLFRDCLCAAVPTLPTATRVIFLRHTDERTKSSNTGRLAHFALPNSEIIDYPNAGPIPPFANTGAALIFPGTAPPASPPPRTIIVLDGTWAQARRMYRKIPALRGVPLLALPAIVPTAARFREAPSPSQVSTIEAVAAALALLEPPGSNTPAALLELFALACGRAAASGRRVIRSPTLAEP